MVTRLLHLLTCSESKVTDKVLLFFFLCVFFLTAMVARHVAPLCASKPFPYVSICWVFYQEGETVSRTEGSCDKEPRWRKHFLFSPDGKVGNINGWLKTGRRW